MSTPPPAAARAALQALELAAFMAAVGAAFYLGAQWMKEKAVGAWQQQSSDLEAGLRMYVRVSVSEAEERLLAARLVKVPRQKPAPAPADPAEDSP